VQINIKIGNKELFHTCYFSY